MTATSGTLTGSPVLFTGTATAGAATQLQMVTQPAATAQSGVAFDHTAGGPAGRRVRQPGEYDRHRHHRGHQFRDGDPRRDPDRQYRLRGHDVHQPGVDRGVRRVHAALHLGHAHPCHQQPHRPRRRPRDPPRHGDAALGHRAERGRLRAAAHRPGAGRRRQSGRRRPVGDGDDSHGRRDARRRGHAQHRCRGPGDVHRPVDPGDGRRADAELRLHRPHSGDLGVDRADGRRADADDTERRQRADGHRRDGRGHAARRAGA